MKKIGLILMMIILSSKVFAPCNSFITSKNWEDVYNKMIEQQIKEQTELLLIEIKSTETWHDSLNYRKGNPYKKVNNIGAMGAWQFMPGTLRWLGYKDSTFQRFLNSKALQKRYAVKLLNSNLHQLTLKSKRYLLIPMDSIGTRIDTIEITLSGLLGGSWIGGVGGVQRLIARRGNASDGNHSVKSYLYKFRNIMNTNLKSAEAYKLMHEGALAFARAEQQGIRVDVEYCQKKKEYLTRKITRLEDEFMQTNFFRHWQHSSKGKININSPYQLSHFLYKVKKLEPPKFTASSTDDFPKGSTDKESLSQLNIPELNTLLEISKLKDLRDKVLTSFVREQVDGYIHASLNLNLAVTYRSSMDSPNMQNIPEHDEGSRRICKRALYPRPGHQLLETDYKGIEVGIGACYHKDNTMLNYLNDPKSDMHSDMAQQIFKMKKIDKSIPGHNILRMATKNGFVFPEFYGSYYKNCANNLACTWGKLPKTKWKPGQGISITENEILSDHLIAKGINEYGCIKYDKDGHEIVTGFLKHLKQIEYDFWSNRFQDYAQWKDNWYTGYLNYGYFDMFTGFRCSGVMNFKEVTNYPIQGTAFHCLLWSFIQVDKLIRKEKLDSRLIWQIHDSMILDVHPNELEYLAKNIKRITCKELPKAWSWIIVPLNLDMSISPVDGSWAEKEKYNV